jgi:hypothetical protein
MDFIFTRHASTSSMVMKKVASAPPIFCKGISIDSLYSKMNKEYLKKKSFFSCEINAVPVFSPDWHT